MSTEHAERIPAARRPSQKVRIAAARVRVGSDQQVGRPTPQWIKDLANTDKK